MRIADLARLRVAIWGLGREGHAAHAALRRRFAGRGGGAAQSMRGLT